MELKNYRFEHVAKIILYILVAFLPLWAIPLQMPVEFGRELTFSLLIVVAAVLWLLSMLTSGTVRYQHSPILYGALIFLVVISVSTVFSKSPLLSALMSDVAVGKLITLILGIVLMVLVGSIFRTREEIGKALFILFCAGTVAGIITLIQFFTGVMPYQFLISSARGVGFSVIGTVNAAALLYAAMLIMVLGLLFSPSVYTWKRWAKCVLLFAAGIFILNLLLINFRTAWMVLLGSGIVLFGLMLRAMRTQGGGEPQAFDWRHWLTLLLLVLSVVMLMTQTLVFKRLNLLPEVSPSFRASINVALGVFREGPQRLLLGSGPGTFGLNWVRYRDPSINQTIFWNLRFNQGFSWVTTLFSTTGILGLLSFLLFLGVPSFLFLKVLLTARDGEVGMATSIFMGLVALIMAAFLYPSNLTFALMTFLFIGMLALYVSRKEEIVVTSDVESAAVPGSGSFWSIFSREIRFQNPWAVFASSLLIIFFLSISVVAAYFETSRMRAAILQQKGLSALNRGEVASALEYFERAAAVDDKNVTIKHIVVQVKIEQLRGFIQRAGRGENIQQEFQAAVTSAIKDSQAATQLQPREPALWRTQGALYELLIPFIHGSEQFAFSSYERAVELDPLNPGILVDLGRAGIAFADRIQLAFQQTEPKERGELQQARFTILKDVEKTLLKAVDTKSDFAPAHFLLAQTAIRAGDVRSAIRSTESARLVAPFDIGIAFQLGLLYYQNNDFNKAEAEFLRTVGLNANYSNARYFLGLIYSRKGDFAKALSEFRRVAELNPDNQEVKDIIANLEAGKSALAGISPPAEAPEKRNETPVREDRRR